ncbi:putative hydro-lyase [Salinicola avicenniae]|uniref:putative hydro-lyase n=1 Tax=Salinicola avicenniae TaxID=2916836 RepID=UPI00207438A0|nr:MULTISPECIES: putative hydro-lyase [unclassified Salinicola]
MTALLTGDSTPAAARQAIRRGDWPHTTTGIANGYAQVNLVIIPEAYASDFLRFCMANRPSCPVLDVTEPGSPLPASLGEDIDLCRDVPRYRVYEHGELVDQPTDLSTRWRDDLVTFSIGCSFSFEEPLIAEGVPVRHMAARSIVPMYRTNIPLVPAGPFHGHCVVSMRAMHPTDAIRAVQITTDMPSVHGAPLHLSRPDLIGIEDIHRPDFGDAPVMEADDIPVFWACGVTPQIALMNAKLPFAMAHAPGHMLITDIPNHRLKYR